MMRSYEYETFNLEISLESDFSSAADKNKRKRVRYFAIVRIHGSAGTTAPASPPASPPRFADVGSRAFATQADALMGGYSAPESSWTTCCAKRCRTIEIELACEKHLGPPRSRPDVGRESAMFSRSPAHSARHSKVAFMLKAAARFAP